MIKNQHGSPKNNDVKTPADLYTALHALYHFDHDPCPFRWDPASGVPDGLESEWGTRNWVNPPYRGIKRWTAKAVEQNKKGKFVLMLIPYRPHTKYWKSDIWPLATDLVLLDAQIRFEGYATPLPINLVLVEWDPTKSPKYTHHSITPTVGYYSDV
jgi:hypothetical protein